MNDLLSIEALMWLKSVDFTHRNHEERTTLIKAAKILFPNEESEILPFCNFGAKMGEQITEE